MSIFKAIWNWLKQRWSTQFRKASAATVGVPGQSEQEQPPAATATNAAAVPVAPVGNAKDQNDPNRKAKSIHEAAHAVVAHEVGGTVNWINVDGHPNPKTGTKTDTTWPVDPYTFKNIDKLDAPAIGKARTYARNMAACFVAGDVAQFAGTDQKLISQRIPNHFWMATDDPQEESDRGMVAWLLTSVGLFDIGEVTAAEQRARIILQQREARHGFLAQKLLQTGFVKPPVLTEGLKM